MSEVRIWRKAGWCVDTRPSHDRLLTLPLPHPSHNIHTPPTPPHHELYSTVMTAQLAPPNTTPILTHLALIPAEDEAGGVRWSATPQRNRDSATA